MKGRLRSPKFYRREAVISTYKTFVTGDIDFDVDECSSLVKSKLMDFDYGTITKIRSGSFSSLASENRDALGQCDAVVALLTPNVNDYIYDELYQAIGSHKNIMLLLRVNPSLWSPHKRKEFTKHADGGMLIIRDQLPLINKFGAILNKSQTFAIRCVTRKVQARHFVNVWGKFCSVGEANLYIRGFSELGIHRLFTPQGVVKGHCCDFVCSRFKVIVECDGSGHQQYVKFEKDRKKDRQLMKEGWLVLRFTPAEIKRDPVNCAKEVLAVMRSRISA